MTNSWEELLGQCNDELKDFGFEIRCKIYGDDAFCILLYKDGKWKETFGRSGGHYTDEDVLQEINEVLLYARKLAYKPETVWVLTTTSLSSDSDFNGKTKSYSFIDEDHALSYMQTVINNETEETESCGHRVFIEHNSEHSFYMTWDGGNEGFMVELNEVELQG